MKNVRKIGIAVFGILFFGFILFLINQVTGLYLLIRDYDVFTAQVVVGIITVILLVMLASPFWLLMKLPTAARKPTSEKELEKYRAFLARRLSSNQHLIGDSRNSSLQTLDENLSFLDKKAEQIIRDTATTVFLTTSVSQNGKLDALTVFSTQMRMIWKVAHVYYQRPTVAEMIRLYSFVGVNTLIASEIEDLDISQQLEPVIGTLFKNASGRTVPFLGSSATIVMDSLLEGSTNAYLTLRVGITAKKYCGHTGIWEPKKIKKEAFRESASQLKKIMVAGSGKIIGGILEATKNVGIDTLQSGWKGVKNTTGKIVQAGNRLVKKKKTEELD